MAKKHFSLPDNILEWLERKAKENGMRRSQYLAFLLMNIMKRNP